MSHQPAPHARAALSELYTHPAVPENRPVVDRIAVAVRVVLWLTLGGWIGALVLFAAVVAPAAFRVLPSSELAGRLVGEVLPALQLFGAAAGILLALCARVLRRAPVALALPLLLGALGPVSLFGITPRMEEVRVRALAEAPDPVARLTFGRLHAVSGALYAATLVGAAALAGVHARAEAGGAAKKKRALP
jgi:hypothetical protein